MQHKWKKLYSKVIFEHPRITLIEDGVQLPNGERVKYLKFKSSEGGVAVIALDSKGRLLLQKEYSYPIHEVIYQFPGGSLRDGESREAGANRELMEEASLKAGKLTCLGTYLTNYRRSEDRVSVYLAEDLREQSLEGDLEEDIESYWFTEIEIDKLILDGELKNGHSLAAWGLYKANKKSF